MQAKVHNKLDFPIKVSDVILGAHDTKIIDLPNGFKYSKNRLSVSYIKTATETEQSVVEDKTVVAEEKAEETKPVVKATPKPKQKRKKRTTKK